MGDLVFLAKSKGYKGPTDRNSKFVGKENKYINILKIVAKYSDNEARSKESMHTIPDIPLLSVL